MNVTEYYEKELQTRGYKSDPAQRAAVDRLQRCYEEWVEYNFGSAKQVSSVEVYWAIGNYEDYKWDLPVSWKIQYIDGAHWQDTAMLPLV